MLATLKIIVANGSADVGPTDVPPVIHQAPADKEILDCPLFQHRPKSPVLGTGMPAASMNAVLLSVRTQFSR